MNKRMSCEILDWRVVFILGLMVLTEVSSRSTTSIQSGAPAVTANTGPSQCPPVPDIADELCMMQVEQTSFPCDQDGDCFLPNHICCPHFCRQNICKHRDGAGDASSTGRIKKPKTKPQKVPKHIKHPDNVPTIDELVKNSKEFGKPKSPAAPVVTANTGSSQCPQIPDIADELCMMQVEQTSFPCDQDGDCFLPNQICCPHFCRQNICKDRDGASEPRSTDSIKKPKKKQQKVPKYIKHPDNVPTIDELVKNSKDVGPRQCPAVPDIADELCKLQVRQTSFPCAQDSDCFHPNQICCPHFCRQKICKNRNEAIDTRSNGSIKKPKKKSQKVPKHIKHPKNVPTIDELVKNSKEIGKRKKPTAATVIRRSSYPVSDLDPNSLSFR